MILWRSYILIEKLSRDIMPLVDDDSCKIITPSGTEIQMDGGGDAILESKILMIFARFFRTKSMDLYSESFDGVC